MQRYFRAIEEYTLVCEDFEYKLKKTENILMTFNFKIFFTNLIIISKEKVTNN